MGYTWYAFNLLISATHLIFTVFSHIIDIPIHLQGTSPHARLQNYIAFLGFRCMLHHSFDQRWRPILCCLHMQSTFVDRSWSDHSAEWNWGRVVETRIRISHWWYQNSTVFLVFRPSGFLWNWKVSDDWDSPSWSWCWWSTIFSVASISWVFSDGLI